MLTEPTILHVDMDAFYASVEQLRNPALRGKPVIVGGDGARGVVASCSYEARFYGVRSAMPSSRAKRLCPQAVFIPGHFGAYEDVSAEMHAVFHEFTPYVEGISLDEAFLDVTGSVRLFGKPVEIAHKIRNRIKERTGLWVTVGGATSKHLAKLASQAGKPKASKAGPVDGKGVLIISADEAIPFLHSLPVRAIWGVGPSAAAKLEKLGITTVRQLATTPLPALSSAMGAGTAQHLLALAWNEDEREVISEREAKSIGHEQTFPHDLHTRDEVHQAMARLADAVASRLRDAEVAGRTITTKVRFGTFETITRARSLPDATSNGRLILKTVDEVMSAIDVGAGVRLLGISMSNLEPAVALEQLALGEEPEAEDLILDDVIDRIRDKFGSGAVAPAQLIGKKGPRVLSRGHRQWGPNKEDE